VILRDVAYCSNRAKDRLKKHLKELSTAERGEDGGGEEGQKERTGERFTSVISVIKQQSGDRDVPVCYSIIIVIVVVVVVVVVAT